MREKVIEFDFAWLEIQGRGVKGSTLTAHKVDRVVNAPRENCDQAEQGDEKKKDPPKLTQKKEQQDNSNPNATDEADKVAQEVKSQKAEPEVINENSDKTEKEQGTFDF